MNFRVKSNQIAVKKRLLIILTVVLLMCLLVKEENMSISRDLKIWKKIFHIPKISSRAEIIQGQLREIGKFQLADIPDSITLNNTKKAQVDIIFFNRVPKVGSEMLTVLMEFLGKRNNFSVTLEHGLNNNGIMMSQSLQKEYITKIFNLKAPATFVKHIPFIEFEKHRKSKPIYINMVRDPVERIISFFHYQRAPWHLEEVKQQNPLSKGPDPKWLNKTFDSCVLRSDPECSYIEGDKTSITYHQGQMTYICGVEPECAIFGSQELLDRAKHNLENEYAVVGVLEDLNTTLAVLEKYIPKFFTGATELYQKFFDSLKAAHSNSFKPKIDEKIKDLVRKKLPREYEFYELCKKRLKLQLLATLK